MPPPSIPAFGLLVARVLFLLHVKRKTHQTRCWAWLRVCVCFCVFYYYYYYYHTIVVDITVVEDPFNIKHVPVFVCVWVCVLRISYFLLTVVFVFCVFCFCAVSMVYFFCVLLRFCFVFAWLAALWCYSLGLPDPQEPCYFDGLELRPSFRGELYLFCVMTRSRHKP